MTTTETNPSLGHVQYDDVRAELFADRSWKVTVKGEDQPLMAELLQFRYRDQFVGPSWGYPGEAALQDLAQREGGTAHPTPRKPSPPGTVY